MTDDSDQLRRLEVISDSHLAYLDADALLSELLDRVRSLLAVDTVAVLVVDDEVHPETLIAHAALGLEEEVRLGVRIPIGAGFAGQVAMRREPVVLDHVGPDVVVNPILWRRGLQSMVGVPLTSSGRLLGVMHVGMLVPRHFTGADVEVVLAAADRVATALAFGRDAADRAAARILQRSLVPPRRPSVPGVQFASRFVTAGDFGIGGDWYDVFALPDGRIGVVIGDVAGSGVGAAVVMGRLRSMIRAYAVEGDSPASVLERLDRTCSYFEPDEMATVAYGVIDAAELTFQLASAGHLPPVLAHPGEEATIVELRAAPPICAGVGGRSEEVMVELRPGSTFALYTDGLVERRGRSILDGLEELRRHFSAGAVEDVCAVVLDALVGDAAATDDTALLVGRLADP